MSGVEVAVLAGLALLVAILAVLLVARSRELSRVRQTVVSSRQLPSGPVHDFTEALALADLADSGLLRVTDDGVITEANRTAHSLVAADGSVVGKTPMEAFLDHRIERVLYEARRDGSAQEELTFSGEPQRTLLVRAHRNDDASETWLILRDLSELRRLQRIRSEFVDNLSHELRTPLTNVRLLTESLALDLGGDPDAPENIRRAVGRIDDETGHLVQMVNELLDLARIERGDTPIRHEPVDLRDVVDSVTGRLRLYGERQGVALRAELPDAQQDREISGDHERVGQLLTNLVHNAIKFSPPGAEVAVRVRPERERILLEVEDHGPGIARRDLDRIFERFYKVDRARSRAAGGTGLGLAIARNIAAAHGGRIWAESVEGEGATFFVALPRSIPTGPD